MLLAAKILDLPPIFDKDIWWTTVLCGTCPHIMNKVYCFLFRIWWHLFSVFVLLFSPLQLKMQQWTLPPESWGFIQSEIMDTPEDVGVMIEDIKVISIVHHRIRHAVWTYLWPWSCLSRKPQIHQVFPEDNHEHGWTQTEYQDTATEN